MNRRECRRIAYGIAYRFVQQAIDAGDDSVTYDPRDHSKIEDELDTIAQRLFERSNLVGQPMSK